MFHMNRLLKTLLFLFLFSMAFVVPIFLQKLALAIESQWVITEGNSSMDNLTPQEARRHAIDDAMRKAVEEVVGINIIAESIISNFKLLADIVKAIPHGKVLEKEVIEKENVDVIHKEGSTIPTLIYRVKMKINVAKEEGKLDPYFRVRASLNRDSFQDGDPMQITIRSNQDCYISVFCILEIERVLILLPNSYKENNFLKANSLLIFPDEEDKQKGIKLRAHIPEGKDSTLETIYILALKKPVKFDTEMFQEGIYGIYNGQSAFIEDLVKEIMDIPFNERAEKFIQYTISNKRKM